MIPVAAMWMAGWSTRVAVTSSRSAARMWRMNDNAPSERLWRGVALRGFSEAESADYHCINTVSSDALTRLGTGVRLQQVDAFVVTGSQHHAL